LFAWSGEKNLPAWPQKNATFYHAFSNGHFYHNFAWPLTIAGPWIFIEFFQVFYQARFQPKAKIGKITTTDSSLEPFSAIMSMRFSLPTEQHFPSFTAFSSRPKSVNFPIGDLKVAHNLVLQQ
jgi:hypothetical protein